MSTLGIFTQFGKLHTDEQRTVEAAIAVAERAYCFQSNFPVGAALIAVNADGHSKLFAGCNVENQSFPATICAERNAATTAIAEGYTRFTHVAVFCKKYPGGSPCGLCRQVLREFGCDAVLLNICDRDNNVRRGHVCELLPAPSILQRDRLVRPSSPAALAVRKQRATGQADPGTRPGVVHAFSEASMMRTSSALT